MDNKGLQDRTDKFWRKTWSKHSGLSIERYEYYIAELLPDELAFATEKPGHLPDKPAGLLVVMLGFSMEPLLQSIAVYKPAQLLVVYNRRYTGGGGANTTGPELYADFKRLLATLAAQPKLGVPLPKLLNDTLDRCWKGGCESPVEVFRLLRHCIIPRLRDGSLRRDAVVVDITGAKKSMISGAYLFAAFAGVRVQGKRTKFRCCSTILQDSWYPSLLSGAYFLHLI